MSNNHRRLSKLNRDAIHLTQLNAHINEALRRIELDTALSTEGMRAAIAVVRAMVIIRCKRFANR
jgi:hypothetical protein